MYVIHVHPLAYWNADIIALFRAWGNWNVLTVCGAILVTAVVVFAVCICLDTMRQKVFQVLCIDRTISKVSAKLEAKIRALLGD